MNSGDIQMATPNNWYDIPSDVFPCYTRNPDLWEIFCNVYKSDTDRIPNGYWTEAEVVQYLDEREKQTDLA
jgi:hypothetical protein